MTRPGHWSLFYQGILISFTIKEPHTYSKVGTHTYFLISSLTMHSYPMHFYNQPKATSNSNVSHTLPPTHKHTQKHTTPPQASLTHIHTTTTQDWDTTQKWQQTF
jgi:hypothetical protein